jgi:hypothetical protein
VKRWNESGLILLEVLVALVVFSLLTVAAMNLLDRVASLSNEPVRTDLPDVVDQLQSDPFYHEMNPELSIVEERVHEDGSVWRVYRYTPSGGGTVEIPVFYSDRPQP